MKTENILQADLLDIIFENRNKEYGAYALRKYYHERMYKALGIIFLLVSILSIYILFYKPNAIAKIPDIVTIVCKLPKTIPTKEETTPAAPDRPKQPIIQKALKAPVFVSTIKLVDSTDVSTKLVKNLDNVVISNASSDGPGNTNQIVKGTGKEPTTVNISGAANAIDKNKAVMSAEIMPSYPGGTEALIKFLKRNLNNPKDLEADETVSVKIMFIVGYDGVLKGFQTVEDGGVAFNNEVIRVLKKMPAWIPGKTAGENVSVYYTIPVKFVPQE